MLPGLPLIERVPEAPLPWQARTLEGYFSGTVVAFDVEHRNLRRTLPSELSTDNKRYAERHPLIVMVGTQRDVSPVVFGRRFRFRSMREYSEACIVVPDVLIKSPDPERNGMRAHYFARLYLDRLSPTLLGRWPYGWSKCLARFDTTESGIRLSRRRKGMLLDLNEISARKTKASDQSFRPIADCFDQPSVIGRKKTQDPMRFSFDWDHATVEPVDLSAETGPRMLIGVNQQQFSTSADGQQRCTAFHLESRWVLSNLFSCQNPAVALPAESALRPIETSA